LAAHPPSIVPVLTAFFQYLGTVWRKKTVPMEPGETLIKMLIIGESSVGKSCLLLRFAEDKFTESFLTTIGIDFKVRHLVVNDRKVKLQIWDTAGQEKFRTITKAYYRGAHGILLVYDVTSTESFNQTRQWMQSIQENMTEPVSVIFVGNKCDMERRVDKEDAQELANEFEVEYFETSAKTGEGVEQTFVRLTTLILESQRVQSVAATSVKLPAKAGRKESAGGCC
jgi:small GTP-binding protein